MFRLTLISKLVLRNSQFHKSVINQMKHRQIFTKNLSRFNELNKVKKVEVAGIEKNIENSEDFGKDYIAAQDPDSFGTLSVNVQRPDHELIDQGDIEEEEFSKNRPNRSRKLRTKEYADIIKDHLKNQRIKEAIDVLEVRMIQEDRVKPENYIYNLVIGGCARVGYSKKAFQLYNKMKQRGLKVTGGTYTSLFNACANAPFINDGLEKANRLREIMIEKGYEPNTSNYNAMIKAYGRCGDIKTAFVLVDEMITKNVPFQVDTFNFVLQACCSDSEMGFRHALLVWHKMYQKNLAPDIYSFNLILRCCRDSNIGDVETTEEVVNTILLKNPNERRNLNVLEESTNQLSEISHQKDHESSQNQNLQDSVVTIEPLNPTTKIHSPKKFDDPTPNLLSINPRLGNLVQINEIKNPEDRLLLLGGMSGFLDVMEFFKVTPDIKTFTELLEVIPSTISAEKKLISTIRRGGIRCDIDFFNILIKKRAMRSDYLAAREVLSMIRTARLEPDIVTYGVLSLACQTIEEARELIDEMRDRGIKMNMHILGAMMKQGCKNINFPYCLEILEIVKESRLKPSEKFLNHIDYFQTVCKKLMNSKKNQTDKKFRHDFNNFMQNFTNWKDEMGLKDISKEEITKKLQEHPWEQFQQPQVDGFEHVKHSKLRNQKKKFHNLRKVKVDDRDQKYIGSD